MRNNGAVYVFWSGKTLSSIGSWLANVAGLYLILKLTNSPLWVALYMLGKMLPAIVTSSYGGVLADRMNRRSILMVLDGLSVLVALIPILVHQSSQLWLVLASIVLLTGMSSVYFPAQQGLIAQLGMQDIGGTNSFFAAGDGLAMAAGALLGGVIASHSIAMAFVANSVSFALSFITVSLLPTGNGGPLPSAPSSDPPGPITPRQAYVEMKQAWITIRRRPVLVKVIGLSVALSLAGGGVNVLLSVVAHRKVGLGAFGISLAYAALGTGLFLGSLLSRITLKSRYRYTGIIALATIGEGVFIGIYSHMPIVIIAITSLVIAGVFSTMADSAQETLIMEHVPQEVFGRFYSFFDISTTTAFAIGTLLMGLLMTKTASGFAGSVVAILWIVVGALWLQIRGHEPQRTATSETSI